MAERPIPTIFDEKKLLEEYRQYDRAVDVVSIFHWLFTETADVPRSVEHFERYPRIPRGNGTVLTPDFTVVLKDGRGIVGEIARIGLPENSVEKLCRQLFNYSQLAHLPVADGMRELTDIDVLYLCPFSLIEDAAKRILDERLGLTDHWYKPNRAPVIYTFAAESDKYTITKWPHPRNGSLSKNNEIKSFADFSSLKVLPSMFSENKVQFAFMNDKASPLYLATRLWLNVFPAAFSSDRTFEVTTSATVEQLRDGYGFGTAADVRSAMDLLVRARVAKRIEADRWQVTRIRITRGRQVEQEALAERVSGRDVTVREPRKRSHSPTQDPLF